MAHEDDVEVIFGATIAGAVAGIKHVAEEINALTKPIREIQKAFKEMGEAMIAAFAVEKFAEFIEKMGEIGEQTERMSQILGVSTTEVQELGYISKITGGSAEQLARAMELLQVKLQQAQAGTSPTAKALEALGLSAKDLIGLPLPEQMNKIADSMSRFADGGNKIALVRELFGRMGDTLLPILNKGSEGLDQLRQSGADAGVILDEKTVKALASVHQGTVTLSAALTALGANLVGYFSESINESTKWLIEFTSDMSALIVTGNLGERVLTELRGVFSSLAAEIGLAAKLLADFSNLDFSAMAEHWTAGSAQVNSILTKMDGDIEDLVKKSRDQMKELLKAPEAESGKPQAPATPFEDKSAQAAAAAELQARIRLADQAYRSKAEHLAAEVKLHQISEEDETKQLQAALKERYAAEIAALTEEEGLYAQGSKERQKVFDEELAAYNKYLADRQRLVDQAAISEQKTWDSAGKTVVSAFNSQTRALLSGTESFSSAMKNVFADLVVAVINELEKMLVELAITKVAKIAVFGPVAAIPGYDLGTDMVTQSGLAMVHAGEQIKPAQSTGPYTGANAGGGGDIHFNFHGMVVGTQQWIDSAKQQLTAAVVDHLNSNPSERPSY